ncbi:hypothetical protein LPN04_31520 [Rugamonas sp. A1-17]|nr:hypothetical protein [Rugamonas sp. A1-17]
MKTEQQDNQDVAQTIAEIDLANSQFLRSESDNVAHVEQIELSDEAIAAVNAERIANYRQRAKNERARGVKSLAVRHQGVAALVEKVDINVPAVAAIFERWFASMEFGIHVIKRRGAIVLGEARAEKLVEAMTTKIAALSDEANKSLVIMRAAQVNATTDAEVNGMPLLDPVFAKPAASHEIQLRSREAKKLLEVFKVTDQILTIGVKLEWNDAFTARQSATLNDTFRDGMKDLSKFLGTTVKGMKNKMSPLDAPAATASAGEPAPAANDTAENAGGTVEQAA